MKCLRVLYHLIWVAPMLCALFPSTAPASTPSAKVVQFALCSNNVESITLTRVPGNDTQWEFVITLNKVGTQQFRQLEDTNPDQLVDIVWAGFSFGRRRLDLAIQSGAEKLRLGSKWFSFRIAQANFDLLNAKLLHKQSLNLPCGFESDEKSNAASY